MIIYLIPILTALTLITAAAGIYLVQTRSRRYSARLQRVVETGEATVEMTDGFSDGNLPILARMVSFFAWLMPGHIYSEPLQWDLAQAGFQHIEARKVFAGCRVLSTATFGLGTLLVTWSLKLAAPGNHGADAGGSRARILSPVHVRSLPPVQAADGNHALAPPTLSTCSSSASRPDRASTPPFSRWPRKASIRPAR